MVRTGWCLQPMRGLLSYGAGHAAAHFTRDRSPFPDPFGDDFVILPTGLRLDADQRFTGKGVTICFIDSGFYPHPDLTAHKNRIKTI